jgi:hypothetical protein
MRRVGGLVLIVVVAVVGTAACSSPAPCGARTGTACDLGRACTSSADCSSENCHDGVCAESCTSAADCSAGEACVFTYTTGTRACSTSCADGGVLIGDSGGLICDHDAVVTCSAATDPGAQCDVCGCSGAGETCVNDYHDCTLPGACYCHVPAAVGAPCMTHGDCASMNCSGTYESTGARLCEVPAGTACTTSDAMCQQCNQRSDATHFVCRQSCDGRNGCSSGICLGDNTTHEFGCYVECTNDSTECGPNEHCDYVHNDGVLNRRYCAPN